jgi:hypothetical protein
MTAAMLAWAYFMLPRVGWNSWRWKALLLLGLAGTQSTAGFGIFLAVWVITQFLVSRGPLMFNGVLRRGIGLGLLALAIYLAVYVPVFGVAAKTTINPVSVSTRTTATLDGLRAITADPLGQSSVRRWLSRDVTTNAGINVLASVAVIGVPGALLGLLAVTCPLRRSQQRTRAAGPTLVVVLTVLASQPLLHSTGLFLLVVLACMHYDQAKEAGAAVGNHDEMSPGPASPTPELLSFSEAPAAMGAAVASGAGSSGDRDGTAAASARETRIADR